MDNYYCYEKNSIQFSDYVIGTREAPCVMNVLTQRCLDMNVNPYVCFIDYEKILDKFRNKNLLEIILEEQKTFRYRCITVC